MIVINKSVVPHNSIGIINTVVALSNYKRYEPINKTSLPRPSEDIVGYRKGYQKLCPKKRNLGLSYKSFKTASDYLRAAKAERQFHESLELKEYIKDHVNGGCSFVDDQECVYV